jgi:hypothetical protein
VDDATVAALGRLSEALASGRRHVFEAEMKGEEQQR